MQEAAIPRAFRLPAARARLTPDGRPPAPPAAPMAAE
jgi:hypothetical protein